MHAFDPAVGDLAAAVVGGAVVEAHVTRDAELLGLVVEDVGEFGVAQQRFGGDAADVQADASPVLLLDDGDTLAQLGGADRGDVPAGSRAEDDDVEVRATHGGSFLLSLSEVSIVLPGAPGRPAGRFTGRGQACVPARVG
ncbi:hypothetical protein GCM10010372_81260 [Streptomyces tauricus]|nr:hypothetical protein GCM10010372_81260 [Streptomyces tauricus]